jgi:hypothetical protein
MDILIAIDDLDDLIARSPHIPLTAQVRIDEQVLRDASGRVRPAVMELFGPFPARIGPIADVLGAVDELERLVAAAERVPLTSQLRVHQDRFFDLLDRLRATLPAAIVETRGEVLTEPAPSIPALEAIDALEELAFESRRGVDEKALRDALSGLRTAFGDLTGPAGPDAVAALEELDDLVRSAKRVPLTSRLRLPREPLYALLDRLRLALAQAASGGS